MSVALPQSSGALLQQALLAEAKTQSGLTVMEHASHVLQVARWMTAPLPLAPRERDLVCLAAALHDIGKAVTRPEGERWVHAPQSAALVPTLLEDPAFRATLEAAGLPVDLVPDELARVQDMCREHHGLTPQTVFRSPGALIVPVADALASALHEGYVGCVRSILGDRYPGLALTVLDSLGRAPWADAEVHAIELPHDTIADLMLAEAVLERLQPQLEAADLTCIMRGAGHLWVAGSLEAVERFLDTSIATADVLDPTVLRHAYQRGQFPRPPQIEPPILEYFFADADVACQVICDLLTRRKPETRATYEKYGLTYARLLDGMPSEQANDPLALGESVYQAVRAWLVKRAGKAAKTLPATHQEWITWGTGRADALIKTLLAEIARRGRTSAAEAKDVASLIMRGTTCRSVSNAVRERVLVCRELAARRIAFTVREVAWIDGQPPHVEPLTLVTPRQGRATPPAPCAICTVRPASTDATAMVAGATQGDGLWASAGRRAKPRICAWCHTAGVVSLPLVTFRVRGGARKERELNYVLVESAFSRDRLAAVLQELGFLDAAAAHEAVRAADAADAAPLSPADEAMFLDIQGVVPEPMTALGIAGLKGSLPVRLAAGVMLPGNTPLASRAAFVLPSATLFGQHTTADMNSTLLDTVAMGLVATLAHHLGPARFTLRVSSTRGAVTLDAAAVTPERLERAEAMLALAEFRRRALAGPATGQSPHELDIDFVLDLAAAPRRAVSRLIREILQTHPLLPASKDKVHALVTLVDRMTARDADPDTELARHLVADLMALGVVPETDTPISHRRGPDGARRGKSNTELCGLLYPLWRVVDEPSFAAWIEAVRAAATAVRDPAKAAQRDARVTQMAERVRRAAHERRMPLRDLLVPCCEQMCLNVFSVSRERRAARARATVPTPTPHAVVSVARRPTAMGVA